MTISLGLIVKDDSDNLARLLREMRPCVDEIVVVDTGSFDNSPKVAKEGGADLVIDASDLLDSDGFLTSFGAARQRGLDACTGDWYLWLDTDDTLVGRELLRTSVEFLEENRRTVKKAVSCSLMYDYSWNKDRTMCIQKFPRERIVCRNDGWRWKRPIHEFLDVDGNTVSYRVEAMRVVHLSDGGRGVKDDRNLRILERWNCENGGYDEPAVMFYYLADEHFVRSNYTKAIDFYEKCIGEECEFYKDRAIFRLNESLLCMNRYCDVLNSAKRYGVNDLHVAYQVVRAMHHLKYPGADIYEFLNKMKELPLIPCENPMVVNAVEHTLAFYAKRVR